jgi:hypothetical protein
VGRAGAVQPCGDDSCRLVKNLNGSVPEQKIAITAAKCDIVGAVFG